MNMIRGEEFTKKALRRIYDAYFYVLVTDVASILNDPNSPPIADSWEPNPYEGFRILIRPPRDSINLSLLDNQGKIKKKYKAAYRFHFGPLPYGGEVPDSLKEAGLGEEYRKAVKIIQKSRLENNVDN